MSKDDSPTPPSCSLGELGAALPSLPGLTAADRAALADVLKGKLQNLNGISSGYIESLPLKVKRRVVALQEIQKQHDEYEAKFFEERAALEAKYQKIYGPLYNKRYDIVNGIVEPEPLTAEEQLELDTTANDSPDEKGVPEFWLTALKTNEVVGEEITKRDEGALKYLKDIKSVNLEGGNGFRLEFYFTGNPFFKNTVLTKTYHMVEDNEPILERATGTDIEWYPEKNLTKKVLQKKLKKGSRNTKPVRRTEECESFFNFFYPPKVPEDDEDLDQEAAEQLQDLMEQDYDIGSTIKDKIIPHAVSWFTGEALLGEEFEDEDEDEEEDSDEDEEGDEDEEDEEEDNVDEKSNKKPSVKASNDPLSQSAAEQPPECKQQ